MKKVFIGILLVVLLVPFNVLAENKTVPFIDKILEDNELKEEIPHMFNYSSNGLYYYYGGVLNNPDYITNGLYINVDDDGTTYYYRGNVDNNNVEFGEYESDYYVYQYNGMYFQSLEACQKYNSSCSESNRVKLANAGDKMYWKIVRVNGDGSLRLIYNGTSTTPDNSDLAHSYAVGVTSYNLEYNDSKYTGYTYDRNTNETDSFIKKEVDTWYKNALGNTVYDAMVNGGRFCSDSSGYKPASEYGFSDSDFNVFASYGRLAMAGPGIAFSKPNTPTLKCPSTSESYGGSYRLKAGLITADELVLAGESMMVLGNSYLNPGSSDMGYWSMSPAVFDIDYAGVWLEDFVLYGDYVNGNSAVRPVINVTTDNGFTSGDGTAENPYVITAE